ncbi:Uncharacterized protein ALO57_03163 [Pseudomonas coronafaciens pv. oryzae]|nr:Uncharacterized protein ALO57_03163 [Pseudomonas coronafaciens pv. oryzae]RMP29191.1 hypothetical protein ALQ25_02049 [Pseudomonas coronafaciens pv. atropurpurea]RMS09506.1 hypothetical protein ALP72_04022 [Pseudomonas coronafaciens pv. coronafaciens]RMT10913.1 hypothetical protein ALP55_03315 [Pseudomonas coronafaciens pv. oryzae]
MTLMPSARLVVLCTYSYDATDRLASCSPAVQGDNRFFYQKNRLAAQIQGQIQHTLLRTDQHLLAQRRTENNLSDCALLATDQQLSVIAAQGVAFAYTPYGQRHPSAGPMNLPGFTGQRVDPVTGHYLLGNGYRAFNPVLMRFNSPDSLSPFGEGGLNAYAYCAGDPVNRVDPSGHWPRFLRNMFKKRRGERSPLLARSTSQTSLFFSGGDSAMSPVPLKATTSGASGMGMHVPNYNTNLPLGAPPPLPPKRGLPSNVPPPIPPKKRQPSNASPPIPAREKYLRIEGEDVNIHEVNKRLDELLLTNEFYTRNGNPVPYVVSNNLAYYRRAVENLRGGNGTFEKRVDVPT